MKIINENETQGLEKGVWYLFKLGRWEYEGLNVDENYVILKNSAGRYILGKKYKNCISIGGGEITEFNSFEELRQIILTNSNKLEEIIKLAEI